MNLFLAADPDASGIGYLISGGFGLVLGLGLICLAFAWCFFPFIVISKFNQLLKETQATRALVTNMEQWGRRNDEHMLVLRKYYEAPQPPVAEPARETLHGDVDELD